MSGQQAVEDWKKQPMSDLGKSLFEQAALINEGQRAMLMEGRKQMAREVRCVVESFIADAHKGNIRPIAAELLALVERELA